MATLNDLVKYLEAGFPLQNSKGEVLRLPAGGQIQYDRLQDGHVVHEVMTMAEAHALRDDSAEVWGVLFATPWLVVTLEQIEALVAAGVRGYDEH